MSRVWPLVRVVLALGILLAVVHNADPGAAWSELRRAPGWAFAVPVGLLLVNSAVQALRLHILLPAPRPGPAPLIRIVLLGNFFGIFLPTGGGEAAKVLALSRYAGGLEEATASLGVVRALELLPWASLLVWGAIAVLPARLPEYVPLAWGAALAFVVALGLVLGTLALGDRLVTALPARLGARLAPLRRVRAAPRRVLVCLGLAFPFALVNGAIVWALLRAYAVPLGYGTVLGLIPAVDVVISLPITVSGLGVREGLFVHSFAAWGISAPVALAIAFTRWTGELGRAVLGGLLFAFSPDRRQPVTARAGPVG